jgi:hypothetical protein
MGWRRSWLDHDSNALAVNVAATFPHVLGTPLTHCHGAYAQQLETAILSGLVRSKRSRRPRIDMDVIHLQTLIPLLSLAAPLLGALSGVASSRRANAG